MHGPVWHSAAYEAWARKVVTDSRETVQSSLDLIRRTDELILKLKTRAENLSDHGRSDTPRS